MSKQSKKLSERLKHHSYYGVIIDDIESDSADIIEAVRELEAEVERLKCEVDTASCLRCINERDALHAEVERWKLAFDEQTRSTLRAKDTSWAWHEEREELRVEVETLQRELTLAREGGELFRQSQYRVEELHLVAIRERDALRTEVEALRRNLVAATRQINDEQERAAIIERERDEARAELADKEGAYHNAWKMAHDMAAERDAAIRERDEARVEAKNASEMYSRILSQRADWEDESDKLYAERDALRAEMETLQRDKDGRIREAFDRMSVAIRERDEARAELAERDAALYEGKSAHEWYSEAYQAAVQRNTYIETAAKGINKLTDERDAALAKLAAARSYVGVPGIGLTARGCASVLNIIDGQKECNINNHCWCEMLDGHVECSKCGQKESDTAPVAADTEVVTREVWLRDDGRAVDSDYVHESTGGPRATVTFHVPKPKPPPVVEAFETEC